MLETASGTVLSPRATSLLPTESIIEDLFEAFWVCHCLALIFGGMQRESKYPPAQWNSCFRILANASVRVPLL